MAPKPSHDTLIHCEACGEDYSSTYRSCPFCGARKDPRRLSGRGDPVSSSRYIPTPPPVPNSSRRGSDGELDDTYVFDGQDAFDEDVDEEYYTPIPKGGKRLAPKEGGGFELPPVNWPRLITFLCSLVIIVAALIIVFTFIYPQLHKEAKPDPSQTISAAPSPDPTPSYSPDVTPGITDDPVQDSQDVDPASPPPATPTPVGQRATIVNASGGLRVRSGPGTSYEILASLYNGSVINVIAPSDNGWYNISFSGSNGAVINGYIMGQYISTVSGNAGGSTPSTPSVTATTPPSTNPPATSVQIPSSTGGPTVGRRGTIVDASGGLRVRSGPGTSYNVVASLLNGNTVTVVANAGNGWYQISFTGSGGAAMSGYIMGDYISTN